MATFYFLRHGLRISRAEDTLLTQAGIQHAELSGKRLLTKNIDHIFVSPTNRTLQTAEVINRYLKKPQSTDERLLERMVYKPEYGTFEDFLEEWDKTMGDRAYQPPYCDSAINAGQRVITLLEELSDNKNYLFISHAGIIGDAVRNLFPDHAFELTTDPVKNLGWLQIPECSITEIHREDNSFSLKRLADTAHLHGDT